MGSPKVESSQSRTAMTRFSVGWKMQLSTRKSPWATDVGSSWSFRFFGSQSISSSISSHFWPSISAARYCFVHVFICLYRETDLLHYSLVSLRLTHSTWAQSFENVSIFGMSVFDRFFPKIEILKFWGYFEKGYFLWYWAMKPFTGFSENFSNSNLWRITVNSYNLKRLPRIRRFSTQMISHAYVKASNWIFTTRILLSSADLGIILQHFPCYTKKSLNSRNST